MKLHRIYAIILRYMFLMRRSLDRLSDAFYWPTIDLLVWGLTSAYFKTFAPDTAPIVLMLVSGILLWLVAWRANYEITLGLLDDLWNKNLINIFVSPLTFIEWISSFLITGIIKIAMSLPFAMGVAYILYKVHILVYGFYLIPLLINLIMFGWFVGFLVAGIILRYGTKIQTLAWSFIAVLSPFSAIYYPVSMLPSWAQAISSIIPVSHVFEISRQILTTGKMDVSSLIAAFGLNLIYLTLSFVFLKSSFKKVLDSGLMRLE
jgi:ABC-2 type transport system permease protein